MVENESSDASSIRQGLTHEQRNAQGCLTIDPGFVNHRLVESVVGPAGMSVIDQLTSALPAQADWQREVRVDQIYTRVLLEVCRVVGAVTLSTMLKERRGRLFTSVEYVHPNPSVYEDQRTSSDIVIRGVSDLKATMAYDTRKIRASTTRSQLAAGSELAIVGLIDGIHGDQVLIQPLIIGAPWLQLDQDLIHGAEWYSHEFFENFVDDIDEFSLVRSVDQMIDFDIMRTITEHAFKTCVAEILGDFVSKDWGGETSDHFSAHVTLSGRRVTAAFLLKGPAKFAPMGLNHLGKNNDQIYRLSCEPASLLVLQHCHEVKPAVRATLRAFAVQPGAERRYCVIDGRDSLRLLVAYNKVDRALQLSGSGG